MISLDKIVVGNAAGMAKTLEDVGRFCKSAATRITVGSVTKNERAVEDGTANTPVSPGDVYFFDEKTGESGNALGLPNMGMRKYLDILPQMAAMAHAAGKELWVSIIGETADEIHDMAAACFACGVDGVEINLACPNVHDKGKQKGLMCQDLGLVAEILRKLTRVRFAGRSIGVKIAPTGDQGLLAGLCGLFNSCPMVCEVVATNTRGGQRFVRDGVDKIAFKPPGSDQVVNTGGQAGRPLHEEAVAVVKALRKYLNAGIRVIGVGGIFTGRDAYNFLKAGADGFMCATAIMEYGAGVLSSILGELAELMPETEVA